MGKPMTEEAKQKIRDAFAKKRLEKQEPQETTTNSPAKTSKPETLITIPLSEQERLAEAGKGVQEGKLKRIGFVMGEIIYSKS